MCGFPSPPSLPAPRCLCIRSPLPHACPVWGGAWMEGTDGLVGGGSGGRVDGGGRGQRGHGAGGHVDGRNLQSWARSPPKMLGSPVGVCPLGDCHRLGGGGDDDAAALVGSGLGLLLKSADKGTRQGWGRGPSAPWLRHPPPRLRWGREPALPPPPWLLGGGGGSPAASGLVGPRLLLHLTCQGGI